MSLTNRIRVGLLVASLVGAPGCGGDGAASSFFSSASSEASLSFAWPPTAGEPYPDLELRDHRGEPVKLSSFEGRVLLIEPIGMT